MPQRSRLLLRLCVLTASLLAGASAASAASLQPTRAALVRQSLAAREAGFSFVDNDAQVHELVRDGLLAVLRGNADYAIHEDVRHAAARPAVKAFVERLASQYRDACGERLVVTSLVRPRDRQPWNSDPLSVHPAGMAVDLRISHAAACRRWLERTLLELEAEGLLEAARERVVPHYHVVVFPSYIEHLERRGVELPSAAAPVRVSTAANGIDALAAALNGASAPAGGLIPAVLPIA
ncbi:MAG: DUF5715 family protein, partial [bacterium]